MVRCPDLPPHVDGLCDGCHAPLAGRQRRWCGATCGDDYWCNHGYTHARWLKLRNARRSGWYLSGFRCEHCGTTTRGPEVNHITPALGAHGETSCAHHQDNLEVLCRDCHLDVTRQQRRDGLFGHKPRPAQDPHPSLFEVA